ncbi:MAG: tetratricopeptide repeat protein, partial [candidate division WOR-3 bacterium]
MEQRAEERRLITLLFADLSGFTALSSQLDPEDVQEVANTTFEILNKPIIEQGGLIHKYEGDLVIALFGLPIAHEDDPERAIKAGFKMMELIPEVNDKLSKKLKKKTDLGLHIGINSGIVVAGEVGSEDKKEWTVMGDVVNLTSRLKDIAKRSEIIVSEPVFRASRYLFDYEVLPPVPVKGIERPIRIFRPLKIKEKPDPKRGIKGLYSPLVGRDKELKILKEKIGEFQKDKGGAIFILGEPGLGKTRLYEELKKDFISLPIYLFESRCSLYDENLSYSTILQILKEIFGISEDTTASIEQKIISKTKELFPDDYKDLAPYMYQLFSVNITEEFKKKIEYLDPQSLKRQIFLAVRRLLFEMAKKQPLILVVEDYHWIDSSSLELFEFIFTNWENEQQLLLIGISRVEKEKECWQVKERLKDKLGEKFFEIALEPLDYESSARLANNLLNILGIPEDFKDRILKKAEGNPFYLEEIIRALIDTGCLKLDAGIWRLSSDLSDIEIPDTVQSLIISRMDKLKPELKQILQIASVIGRFFYRRILQYVSNVDDLLLTLQLATLEEFEYIKESKTENEISYLFRHPLLQEVIYNNILKKKRKELHNSVAECIEKLFAERINDFCDLLSQQFYLAENWEKALTYSIKSAEKAKRLYLNKQAIELYERAEECAEMINNTVKKIYCIKEKTEILNLIGETKSALDEIGKAIELSRNIMDKKSEADCLIAISDIYANLSRYEDMLDSASKALSIYKTINDKRGEAESLNNMGYAYEHFGEYNKALEYYNKSLKIQEKIDNRDGQALSLNNIGNIYEYFGEYDKALSFLVKSLNIRDEMRHLAGQATSLNNIGAVYDDLGEYAKALEYYKKSLKIQKEINDMDGKGTSLNNIGYLFSLIGDYKKALEYYMESLKIRIEIGDKDGQATSLCNIGVIYG